MQTAFEVFVAIEIAIGFLDHDVPLEQETLEDFTDVERWEAGFARAACEVLQVEKHRHSGVGFLHGHVLA